MDNKINQEHINKALVAACDIFRGTIDSSNYKDFVLTILFLKYISDVHKDKKEDLSKQFPDEPEIVQAEMLSLPFQIPNGASFWDLYEQRHEPDNGKRIDKALHDIKEANGSELKEVFRNISFDTDKLGEKTKKNKLLISLLENFYIAPLNGSLNLIGNAYEFLIRYFASNNGKYTGEFYTPSEVSDLLSIILEPKEGDSIYDPACGSGSLLIKCGQQIQKNFSGSKQYTLFGQEYNGSTWSLAKINMFLHKEDNHYLEWGDTIRDPRFISDDHTLKHFNVVTANPPFHLENWGYEVARDDKFKRFNRGIPPKTKGDYAFISHMIKALNEQNGRMGIVVPHGVLFRASSEGKIRQKLIEENLLDAVIGLPEKLFFGTSIPAAILIFKKNKIDNTVLFIDGSNEFRQGKNQNSLTDDNIQKIVNTYKNRESTDKYSYLSTLEEIAKNDYNLNIPRYVDTFVEEEEIDLSTLHIQREKLKSDLTKLENEMSSYLRDTEKQLNLS